MLNHLTYAADAVEEGAFEHMIDSGHWFGGGGFMVFWMILMMAAFVLLIVWLVKSVASNSSASKDSLEIAKSRYAKGDIDKKEYENIKKEINNEEK